MIEWKIRHRGTGNKLFEIELKKKFSFDIVRHRGTGNKMFEIELKWFFVKKLCSSNFFCFEQINS